MPITDSIDQEFPTVQHLQVHLEDEQFVVFNSNDASSLQRASDNRRDTQLTAYFKAVAKYPAARDLYYADFPSQFTWHSKEREWRPRKKRVVYGRMAFVPPTAGEKYYARMILSVAKNLQSFRDMRTFNGTTYDTFREACHARGLLDNDEDLYTMLNEAIHLRTGPSLRSLFLSTIRECYPSQPLQLWHRYKASLCDDLQRTLSRIGFDQPSPELAQDYGLHLLQTELGADSNRPLTDFGLLNPHNDWNDLLGNEFLRQHSSYDPASELRLLLASLPLLNADQRVAFNSILDAALAKEARTFFVEGAAGAGKTFLYNALCHALRSREMIVLCVASSGIASLLLPGGKTAHSSFKIPIDIHVHSSCSLTKHCAFATFVKAVALIIWDECSMQHRFAFEAVDRTLQDLREISLPFGGITTVLGGDFLQILPVMRRGTRSVIVHACILSSPLWPYISPNVLKLHENMRLTNHPFDRQFALWLRQLARGDLNEDDTIQLPPFLLCQPNTLQELIKHAYPDIASPHDDSYFLQRCILCPRNRDVREINSIVLDNFPGTVHEMWSVDKAVDPDNPQVVETNYTPEFLHSLTPSGFPPADLKLKKGCPIIVLRNLQPSRGVCNGSRGIVTRMERRVLEVRLLSGKYALIPRIKLIHVDPELPYQLHRLQFPVTLAFGMTINKAQGQSFNTVGIDLRNPTFTHGQLYVALSRGHSAASIKCLIDPRNRDCRTTNVVFREVIL